MNLKAKLAKRLMNKLIYKILKFTPISIKTQTQEVELIGKQQQ